MMSEKYKNKISFTLFLTSVLTFFLLWIIFAEPIRNVIVKNSKETATNNIINIDNNLDLKKFWEAYFLVKNHYYDLEWIKKQDLVDWAINWMINSIWDKHSQFMNTKESKSFNDALSWDFEWIWAIVEINDLGVKIDRIFKWSPAKKYWLLKDDILIEANWESLKNLELREAVDKIKWLAWTDVLLKILRSWEVDILEINVVRGKINIPTVETKEFDENNEIAYIALNMYGQNSAYDFKKALFDFKYKKGIIIDLRDNWGWFLHSAVEILSNFIENWKDIVEVREKDLSKNTYYKSVWYSDKYKWKIVILINWNSASASEITAWCLKDYNKAILVWINTYWKWSVQEPFEFSDWSQLKLTIAKWFTPKWVNIDKDWIKPDIKVEFKKEDYLLEECILSWRCKSDLKKEDFEFYDRQLEVSKKVLEDFIKFKTSNITISKFLEKKPEYKNDSEEIINID